jgi:anti-sigma factor RsiW
MINQDSQLKLQAFLDGELSDREAAEVRDWLARDSGAQALLTELCNTSTALAGNETACRVPEGREFYWSKIERAIELHERRPAAAAAPSWYAWLQRHFVSVGGVALLSCLMAMVAIHLGRSGNQFGEMELASGDMSSYTFRDQQQRVTMVWLYDHNDSQFTDASDLASVSPE